ncbi:hypothetical protein FNU79_01230 [Deinococcus detaillensis]|uniref:Uncharacterized protein n=1 Tax=Deinococcus detaillensis TaxID=2592048 RepID=A0A553V607_9DEIO|nr:hypothetical protein [Deinococcus detaillensis]TSA87897.1 hypothetical protein FNU79_01230 [Deinococcus detaillensis]
MLTAASLPHCAVCGAIVPASMLTGPAACPACAVRSMAEAAAADHLTALLTPIIQQWAAHWVEAGLSSSTLASLLELEGNQWAFTDPLGSLNTQPPC